MREGIAKILENRHTAGFKAIVNLIVVPVILGYLTKSIISSILWIVFLTWLYKFHKKNTENGRVFFEYMKNIVITLLSILLISAFVILTSVL